MGKGHRDTVFERVFRDLQTHLNPGGVVTQWVPLYESDPDTIKSELATFFEVFPNGTVWANDNGGEGYDVVLMGQNGDAPIDIDQMNRRFTGPVAESLKQVGFSSVYQLLATYAGRASDLRPWLTGAHINTDLDLRLQYMAGMGLNYNNAPEIRQLIGNYARFPEGMFKGTPEEMQELEAAFR